MKPILIAIIKKASNGMFALDHMPYFDRILASNQQISDGCFKISFIIIFYKSRYDCGS